MTTPLSIPVGRASFSEPPIRSPIMSITPRPQNPRIEYVSVKAETNKAVRKLVEDEVCQAVRRAVNAWLYTQAA